jgi:hypothetical protein
MDNDDIQSTKRFSSFTPILILVLSFLFVNVIQITNTITQRSELKKIQVKMDAVLPQAKTINETSEGLLRDLVAMAPSSPGAQKIVTDFQVRLSNPNGGPAPAPAPAHK